MNISHDSHADLESLASGAHAVATTSAGFDLLLGRAVNSPLSSQTVTDVIIPMALIIEAPVFKEDNKWRFSDGAQSFFANVEDKTFLARVNAGERFGKGDILLAEVRINQQQTGMKLSADRSIIRVREHKSGPTQLSI